MKTYRFFLMLPFVMLVMSCDDDDEGNGADPTLTIPDSYISSNYEANVTDENTVITELATMTGAANDAEAAAPSAGIQSIAYPSTLSAVTLSSYRTLIEGWLPELVASANDPDGFENPGPNEPPAMEEEGGKLGERLLDENGLELEQMVQKGSFGAALYNHALDVINNGDLTDPGTIDKLIEIHGTEPTFNPDETTAAATYSRRRSNQTTETGFFYDIETALITARAAIEAGRDFDTERDQALADYLIAWEESNFATVIYYCNETKVQLQEAETDDEEALGDALHAYAEGVAFAHGFKGLNNKQITDAQIDNILALLLAPEGEVPTSYQFLNNATLLDNLDEIIDDLQAIYSFTDAQINQFFVNDPS